MIDIHTHILPFVDDGSFDENISLSMLKECVNQGVTDVILTPHYRRMFKKTPAELKEEFERFKCSIKAQLPINVYLGQEFYIDDNYKINIEKGQALTINGTKYLLIEFEYINDVEMVDIVYEVKRLGYLPIVAHYERYFDSDLSQAFEIKNVGGLIQVNADSIVGAGKKFYKKLIKQLFKNDLVDFVASDVHFDRENLLLKAKTFVEKKYGKERAQKLFIENGQALTINGTKYLLIEFEYINEVEMVDTVYEIKRLGYLPIVAHYERYFNSDLSHAFEIKNVGGFIQVNADSLVGASKKFYKKLIKQLFKNDLVDFVASDVHYDRENLMLKAKTFVEKKYGKDMADKVFVKNAKKLIEG